MFKRAGERYCGAIAKEMTADSVAPRKVRFFWKQDLGIFPDFCTEGKLLVIDEAREHARRNCKGPAVMLAARERNDVIFPMAANRQRDIFAGLKERRAPLSRVERPLNQSQL